VTNPKYIDFFRTDSSFNFMF